jgi:hypothetical protein
MVFLWVSLSMDNKDPAHPSLLLCSLLTWSVALPFLVVSQCQAPWCSGVSVEGPLVGIILTFFSHAFYSLMHKIFLVPRPLTHSGWAQECNQVSASRRLEVSVLCPVSYTKNLIPCIFIWIFQLLKGKEKCQMCDYWRHITQIMHWYSSQPAS